MKVRDKLYAVEVDTTAYSFILAAREEKVLMDALSLYAQWEALQFLSVVEQDADAYDEPEKLKEEIIRIIQLGDTFETAEFLEQHYDLFQFTFHIIHKNEPIGVLWQVRNFNYADKAANEYIPNPMWVDSAGAMQAKRMNTDPKFHAEPVFIVNDADAIRFEIGDGDMIITFAY